MISLRIFIAHPLYIVREGLRTILQRQNGWQCVGDSDQTLDVLMHVQALAPNLVILGADLQPLSGLEIARQLQHTSPATRVLLLGKQRESADARHAFAAGAAGYVAEQADDKELLLAIRAATNDHAISNGRSSAARRNRPCQLSEREEAVTRLLAMGYTGKEIAAQFHLSPKTIETYKSRSLEKLGITSRTGIVKYAVEKGWLNPQSSDATASEQVGHPSR